MRDAIIVTLNKSLFDRSDQVKQIGMCGLLQLMKIFKITTALPVTQLSQSSGSLTQMSVGIYRGSTSSAPASASVNVTLCSEMVGAVRRGLTQSVPVRQALYSGLHDVVARNPVLCCDVVAALYEHAQDMGWATLRSREMCGGLIDVDAVIEDRDNSAIVKV